MQDVREMSRIDNTENMVRQLQDVGTKNMMERANYPAIDHGPK